MHILRPEVRVIEDQKEEIIPANISNYEKEMLLAKYGYANTPQPVNPYDIPAPTSQLTFEEMCKLEEEKVNRERQLRNQKLYGPKPSTFDSNDYSSDVKYGTEADSGMSFKVTIVSDMHIPKNY